MKNLLIIIFFAISVFSIANYVHAKPKTKTTYSRNLDGFAQARIKNNTTESLACYVAIDGYKIKFRLTPKHASKWYSSTDKTYKYTDFSTWCGFIEQYPAYLKYKMY